MFLPEISKIIGEFGIELPAHISAIPLAVILFSIVQIILGFIIDKRITATQVLTKDYQIVAMMLLLINLTIIPIMFILMSFSINQSLYYELNLLN